MARPKNKKELKELSNRNYKKLIDFVNEIPLDIQEKEFPKGTLNRNIKDVLAHLHHWHLLMERWYNVGMQGKKPNMPAKGYTWKTLPDFNKTVQEKYKNISLKESKKLLSLSFEKIQKIIDKHSNEELFEKKKYHWTGSTSLGAYLISNTSSHYDWALKLIKKQIK